MKTADFDFELPPGLIAAYPARPRDSARLLVVGSELTDHRVSELPDLLQPGDLLVFNDTKVIPAQLEAKRAGVRVEVTLHRRLSGDEWAAFARPAKRLKTGDRLQIATDFTASVTGKGEGGEVTLRFDRTDGSLMKALEAHGVMPLPPYIRKLRKVEPGDAADYQTVFAARAGAVAAPTAGLHFTEGLMERLRQRNIGSVRLTLHVGAGVPPVKVEDLARHRMHAEYGELTAEAAAIINRASEEGRRLVAVGTTSLRLLESAAGEDGRCRPFAGETDIFITPGFRFRTARLLMTNFHLPRSTLFMLVGAFAGLERMHAAYRHAIASGYRFFSYGDATLLERADP
jgi:S-adenosylmethionine:tRNA ribosyltransferase-isomerase